MIVLAAVAAAIAPASASAREKDIVETAAASGKFDTHVINKVLIPR